MFLIKTTRRMIILGVIFVLMFSSYSSGAKTSTNDPTNIPVYEEQTFGEGFINNPGPMIRLNSKKQLVIYDASCFSIIGQNGEPVRQIKTDFTGDGHMFALDSQDNLYVVVQDRGAKETARKLYVYSPKGDKLKTLDLGKVANNPDKPNFVYDMAVDSNGVVYLIICNTGLFVIGKDSKSLKEFCAGEYQTLVVDAEDNLIVKGFDSKKQYTFLRKIKAISAKKLWETKMDGSNWITRLFYNPADKFIYALGFKRIDKYNLSGKPSGVIFDFFQNNLVGETLRVDGLAVSPSKDIFVTVADTQTVIKKYTPVTGAKQDKNQKVITIAVPKSWGSFLENACGAFRKKHPDFKVNIKEYVTGDSWEAYEDARKILNTEILAGKGADIISVYMLPYKKYIDKNLFVNLTDLVAQDKELKANLDLNVLQACQYKGKLYVLPVNIGFSMSYANQKILDREGIKIDDHWTWRDFLDVAIKVTKDTNNDGIIDQYALPEMEETTLFNYIFESNANLFIDFEQRIARFDTPEFREVLTLAKSIKKYTNPQVDFQKIFEGEGRDSVVFYPTFLTQYYDPVYYREQLFQNKVSMLSLPSSEKGIHFTTTMLYAINNNSRFKNEAWELLRVMLSEELQNSQENFYFPVNMAARKAKSEYAMTKLDNINGKRVLEKLTTDELSKINELIDRIDSSYYSDSQVWKIVSEEAGKFFKGEKTVEEVSRIIQSKVNTYLNE